MKFIRPFVLTVAVLCLGVSVCRANVMDAIDIGFEEGSAIGIGVLYISKPYVDADDEVYPVPLVNLKYKRLYWDGAALGFNLNEDDHLKFSVIGAPRLWGYEPSDSSALTRMTKRKWGFDGGLRAEWVNELCTLQVNAVSDISGASNGQEYSAYVKKEFFDGFLTPRIGVRYYSQDLVDYYFGVRPSEARAGRPAYSPDGTAVFAAGATVAYPLGDQWALVADASLQVLTSEITNSPIVEDKNIFSVATGVVYRY